MENYLRKRLKSLDEKLNQLAFGKENKTMKKCVVLEMEKQNRF